MCGIHAAISADARRRPAISPTLERGLRKRGPDHLGTLEAQLDDQTDGGGALLLSFTSTVLSLRGDHVARQPLVDAASGSVLCWNGEAWRIRGDLVQGNDGEAVLAMLAAASTGEGEEDSVLDALRSIEGPFAFIYFDKPARRVYYGRDRLGRRSLLVNQTGKQFTLSSIAEPSATGWAEVEADGCYTIELDQVDITHGLSPSRHDWDQDENLVSSIGVFNTTVPEQSIPLTRQSRSVEQLGRHLTESLRLRVLNVPVPPNAKPSDAGVAILFSGGLDCTVLARVVSDIIPPDQVIDLINVAFENPRIASQHRGLSSAELYELCPDRVTGRKSFAELLTVCPNRGWRFVTVDIPYDVTSAHRAEIIDLMYPHNTEMDLSIAYALYFAARGQGMGQMNSSDSESQPYMTTARILLSGLGADELFGGYVRHATAFERRGYAGLIEELKLDVSRLGKRNLGRDDRVMAHWSREVRFPYLDEDLVKWAIELPAWEKCDFGHQGGESGVEPGKRVLRLLADQLGMNLVATEKKRAIQFGARTAKMESGKVKGTSLILS